MDRTDTHTDRSIDLNDTYRVKMNDKGVEMLVESYTYFTDDRRETVEARLDRMYPGWRDGVVEMQLYRVMSVFGRAMQFEPAPRPIEKEMELVRKG